MKWYLVRKTGIFLASLFLVASLTFFLMQAIPGDPFTQEQAIPEEILKAMYHHYGLDQPWYVQYGKYLKGLITGNLGPSFKYQGRSVNEIIMEGFPVSFALGSFALTLATFFGLTLGVIAGFRHQRWQDHTAMIAAVIGISVPSFILATFLQYIFAMKLDLLPVARWGSFSHAILPAMALAAMPTAFIARMTRASVVEVLQSDYILTAKAKGLGVIKIAFSHVLKNALLPVITYLGPLTASIITGSFAIEKIFGIPGLGQWYVVSIMNRDYTVIMGTTVFYSFLLMVCVFCVDLLYCVIDPRMKKGNYVYR
ncbi:MAG: ABC transporter permease [Chlamydiota bacterium]